MFFSPFIERQNIDLLQLSFHFLSAIFSITSYFEIFVGIFQNIELSDEYRKRLMKR